MLYVVEHRSDINSLLSSHDIDQVSGIYKYYSGRYGLDVVICEAGELRDTICGHAFSLVIFYEGLFSAHQINYALSRVRSVK
jgi:hypothetical protein